jgi:DNA repair photolyase
LPPRPISNPPNPWSTTHVEWLEEPPAAALHVYEEEAKSVLTENDSPDVGFRFSVNPYRGCQHSCSYCYARPSHQYLGFGAGTDFERRIVVKTNAPEALRRDLSKRSWKGDRIAFSGNTDCYQPLEASYGLTRRCLETCLEFRNPVSIITKGILIRRDVDVLARLAREADLHVNLSIPFADDAVAKQVEPGVASPARRFEAMKALADAGVPVGIGIAPMVLGLNDSDVPRLLERARECGATRAFLVCLRLPAEVLPVFRERIEAAFPERAKKIFSRVREVRGGKWNVSEFGERMHGRGPSWEVVRDLFEVHCKRLGLNASEEDEPDAAAATRRETTFRRPGTSQGLLFDE